MPETTTNNATANPEDQQRRLLEAFLVGNSGLLQLEALLSKFNLFDALGIGRHEIRHSHFLAFLLNPRASHGMGELFLKRFLQRALARGSVPATVTPIEIDLCSLSTAEVLREWQGIDVLVRDQANRLAVVIENKIDSTEHSDQLQRYMEIAEREFKGWKVLGLYLTPAGDAPSDEEKYTAIDYTLVCETIEEITNSRILALEHDFRIVLEHYAGMLRRYVVAESEISELCQRIYEKHREALDLIYEHRPDRQQFSSQLLQQWVKERDDLEFDSSSKTYTRFIPKSIDVALLKNGAGWTPTGRMLLFELNTTAYDVTVRLYIGPGPVDLRQRLYEMAVAKKPLFKSSYTKLQPKWNAIYSRKLVGTAWYHKPEEEFSQELRKQWEHFLQHDLPPLVAAIRSEAWIFNSGAATTSA